MLDLLTKTLLQHFEIHSAKDFLLTEGFWSSSKALLSRWFLEYEKKNIIWIHPDPVQITQIIEDIYTLTGKSAITFPAWEFLPDEQQFPTANTTGKRIEALQKCKNTAQLLICTPEAFIQKTLSKESLEKNSFKFCKGDLFSREDIESTLQILGFTQESLVVNKGTFSIRGAIVDLFPPQNDHPFRIEFFGNEIESIRLFDTSTQKSISKIKECLLLPAQEQTIPGLVPIIDHFKDPVLFLDQLEDLEDRFTEAQEYVSDKFFFDAKSFFLKNPCLTIGFPKKGLEHLTKPSSRISNDSTYTYKKLHWLVVEQEVPCIHCPFSEIGNEVHLIDENLENKNPFFQVVHMLLEDHFSVTVVVPSDIERKVVIERLEKIKKLSFPIKWLTGQILSSIICHKNKIALISANDLLHKPILKRAQGASSYTTSTYFVHDFSIGDYVVHFSNGIGIYRGVEKRNSPAGKESEFLCLEYSGKSFLYVPIHQSHLITPYIHPKNGTPKLDLLGSNRWKRTRAQAEESVQVYAKDILKLYAERHIICVKPCPEDSPKMLDFEANTPFIPTVDQLKAIQDVKNDLCSTKVMDRLICGDVGFGKTEVAIRAAFKMVVDGKAQVAILVPTTILALQQYETFVSRMEAFDIRIAHYSRLTKSSELGTIERKIKEGEIDIVIGTHRILRFSLTFHNLGLMIIDEEQRFGVKAKEQLKTYSQNAHCLTLSATPIPRTFYMSLIGARELSYICTPPQDRVPIAISIVEKSELVIKNAIRREFARGGSVYAIHNRIETLYGFANYLRNLVPQAKIGITHGKMQPEEIERVFQQFKRGEIKLLVSTTIVENGIDIPQANTILIDNAHTFGLADLYQLKGRVGRWDKKAFAYFLIPNENYISDESRHRLQALKAACAQGGGMRIAMQDLEIRGCGNILGTEQSGHISTIGFHLYCKLLKNALMVIKGEKVPPKDPNNVFISLDAISLSPGIPDHYIPNLNLRINVSRKMGDCLTVDEVTQLEVEIIDRFGGPLPKELEWLFVIVKTKILAAGRGVSSIRLIKLKEDPDHTMLQIERMGTEKTQPIQQKISIPNEPITYLQLMEHIL